MSVGWPIIISLALLLICLIWYEDGTRNDGWRFALALNFAALIWAAWLLVLVWELKGSLS